MCLLSLLYATIQSSLLCACSAFYMPQYSRAYCVPAQSSICHNTVEPTVCLLSLLYATIRPSLLYACSGCCMPAACLLRLLYACSCCCMPVQVVVCLLRPLYACSGCCMPAKAAVCLLRLLLPWSEYTLLYCKINSASLPLCNTKSATTHPSIQSVYCNIMAQQPNSL